jgi:hypothetical protein
MSTVAPAAKSKRAPLRQIQCPNCGAPVNQFAPDSQTLVCQKCSSTIALGAEEMQLVGKPSRIPAPPVPIKIGDSFKWKDIGYFVLGRVRYEGWDDEETWAWDEWQVGTSDGRLLWMSYDEKGFSVFNKLRMRTPFNPMVDLLVPVGTDKDGKPQRAYIKERYPARIRAAEGELTWRAAPGEQLYMAEGAGNGKVYSIQKTDEELEVYEGEQIPELDIANAFGNAEWAKKVKSQAGFQGALMFAAFLACAFGIAALLGAAWATTSGEFLGDPQRYTLSAANPTVNIPVMFNQLDRPVVIVARASTAIDMSASVDIDVDIDSPNGEENELFTLEFWRESGVDEGEYWEEAQTSAEQLFVPRQTGEHQISVTLGERTGIDSVTFELSIRRNYVYPMWLLVYGACATIFGVTSLFMVFAMSSSKK